jgi:hypothetical protein
VAQLQGSRGGDEQQSRDANWLAGIRVEAETSGLERLKTDLEIV